MLTYPLFYKAHGVRQLDQMKKPPLAALSQLFLPVNAVYHYMSSDADELGIPEYDTIVAHVRNNVMVEHVTELRGDIQGKPILSTFRSKAAIQEYQHKHKKMRLLTASNKGVLKSVQSLMAVNYNMLAHQYHYMETRQTPYIQWANIHATLWNKVKDIASMSDRQQFILVDIPLLLPSIRHLQVAKTTHDFYHHIKTDALRMIRDMWDWIGDNRDSSLMSKLTTVELNKLNVVFTCGSQWVTINLGVMDGWRQTADVSKQGHGFHRIPADRLQKMFLYMLMCIVKRATPVASDAVVDTLDETAQPSANTDEDDDISSSKYEAARKGKVKKTLAEIIGKQAANAAVPTSMKTDKEVVEDIPDISDEEIEADLAELESIHENIAAAAETAGSYTAYVPTETTVESGVADRADALAKKGLLTPAEVRRVKSIAGKYRTIPNPYTGKGNLEELMTITSEDTAIDETTPMMAEIPGVFDKSMLSSSLVKMDRQYIKNVLPKDIAKVGMHLQRAGFAVADYRLEKTDDVTDAFDTHVFRVVPVVGKPSTIRIQIPRVQEDGTFRVGGIKYRMRKQRGDIPIRKISPSEVALTSYYSKMFVVRSERAVFNYPQWLVNQIMAKNGDPEDHTVTEVRPSSVFNPDVALPRTYTTISMRISGFTSGDKHFSFDYNNRHVIFGKDVSDAIELKKKLIPVGTTPTGVLAMDMQNIVYFVDTVNAQKEAVSLGTIEEIISIPLETRPLEIAEIEIFGKSIPLGIVMAYHVGLGNLMKTLGVEPRRERIGSNYNLQPNDFILKFEDEALIFDRRNELAALILGGFNRYHRDIKRYSVYAFDTRDVYGPVLDANEMNARYVREMDVLFSFWIDHITEELLAGMHEPTNLFELFISAAKRLLTDKHPAEMHSDFLRDKGYERIAGMAYFEMVKALRTYNAKPLNANNSLDVNPQAVWMSILKDQTVMPVDDSNPVHALKDVEVVVFSGSGGRSTRSMTGKSRVFDRSNMGLVSEATVDSADVATITYTSADPNYTSVRGTSRRIKDTKNIGTKMVSTSMLLAPGADHDDPKRANAISVQNSQTTHCNTYRPAPIRTGYERVLIHRCEGLYGKVASDDGKVSAITDNTISVLMKDGRTEQYQIGRQFGRWSGHDIPHDVVTDLKVGQSFKKGDPLIYNTRYFQRDLLDPTQVIFKMSLMGYVTLMENENTLEDGSVISGALAERLITTATHVRNIKVTFEQEIRNLIKIGENLASESILCTIHNRMEGNSDVFDDAAISTLSHLASTSPKAKLVGTVDKIEVFYTGELEEMSASLRELTLDSDQKIRRQYKELGKKAVDGRVDVGYRVDGHPLAMNEAVVRVYVTGPEAMGEGDKVVFGNQLKSVVGAVMSGINETEGGQPIDAMYGYQGVANRIVLSVEMMGTTNTLLMEIGKRAVALYRGKK